MLGAKAVTAHFSAPVTFYHLDVLGSVRMITDSTGTVVSRSDYLAFGEEIVVPGSDPRRFTGKELDPETALQYFGARYYRSETGRFTSVDPVLSTMAGLVDPQRWNRYANSLNNPTRYVDPNGKWPSGIHERLIRAAFPFLSESAKVSIIQGSLAVDNMLTGHASDNAYKHGMRAPWQTAEAARAKADAYIETFETIAKARTGSSSLVEFGHALHTVLDRTSPEHRGEQVWFDNRAGLLFGLLALRHHEDEEVISEAEFIRGVAEARRHFLKVYGADKYFQATGCTTVVHCGIPDDQKPWYLRSGGS
jgi:RHS repeat-associated protein